MIDISMYDESVDSPEVAALKERVRQVADKYTSRHGWCSEVKKALREAGVLPENKKIAVDVAFSLAGSDPATSTIKVKVSELVGLDEEGQKSLISKKISPEVTVAGVKINLPVNIVSFSAAPAPPSIVPEGQYGFFLSDEGRVTHLVTSPSRFESSEDFEEKLLQNTSQWVAALCGNGSYYVTTSSARDENRLCANCARAVDISV